MAGQHLGQKQDQEWQEGCSKAGATQYRFYYDNGVLRAEYSYNGVTTDVEPSGFTRTPCVIEPTPEIVITAYCNTDTNTTVFQREEDGVFTWFDASGTIAEPPNLATGECPNTDPTIQTADEVICLEGKPAVRRFVENYVADTNGDLVLDTTQTIYFDQDGTIWDSGSPSGTEPSDWYFGQCAAPYIDFRFKQLCELDDEKLLLIDSGGGFAEYSFYDQSLVNVPLSIASSGGSADPDNFLLYNFVAPDQLYVTDVNTKTFVNQITLTGATGTEPLTFSAAAFDVNDGFLYSQDTGGADAGIYRTNVNTGVVEFVSSFSGISGNGTSMAIDFSGRMIIMGSAGRVYEIDRATGAGTLIYTSPGGAGNGATFDADGFLYLTAGLNTYKVNLLTSTEENIIDDWAPGANSIAYYRTKAQVPACFFRKYGVTESGDFEYVSDHYVADGSERVIAGAVGCCDSGGSSAGGSSTGNACGNPTYVEVCPPSTTTEAIKQDKNSNVPAGLKAVLISNLSGITTIDGGFELGAGTRPNSITIHASSHANSFDGRLPEIVLAGGTWQWISVA